MRAIGLLAAMIGLIAGACATDPTATGSGVGIASPAETDLATFRRLRAEATGARDAGDLVAADRAFAAADRHVPNHPGVIVQRARLAMLAGDPATATALMRLYADAGLAFDLSADRALTPLLATAAGVDLVRAFADNRRAIGTDDVTLAFEVWGAGLVESVARDEAAGRWLVSQIRGRTILAVDDTGVATPWLAPDETLGGVGGLAIDPTRGLLWATVMALPPALAALPERAPAPPPALLRINLASATVTGRYAIPDGSGERGAGDVVLADDGTVYVANPVGGDIFRLSPGADALAVVAGPGTLGSPQGMVVTPDGSALIVADYSSGLWRIDRDTGASRRLAAPRDAVLVGIDGLISDGVSILALQNGVAPQRVLRLTPGAGWSRIDAVRTLAANLPAIDEPTTGLIHRGDLVFVSRSQWRAFDGEGALTTPDPGPALISRLRLPSKE